MSFSMRQTRRINRWLSHRIIERNPRGARTGQDSAVCLPEIGVVSCGDSSASVTPTEQLQRIRRGPPPMVLPDRDNSSNGKQFDPPDILNLERFQKFRWPATSHNLPLPTNALPMPQRLASEPSLTD
jgi:hypothetical protein